MLLIHLQMLQGKIIYPNGITLTYGDSILLEYCLMQTFKPRAGTFWDYDGTIPPTVAGSGFPRRYGRFYNSYVFVNNSITNKTLKYITTAINNLTKQVLLLKHRTYC